MAYEEALKNITVPANADLSALQFTFMLVNGSGKLANPAAGGAVRGVLQNDPDAADVPGTLAISGVSRITCGAAVTAGDQLTPGTSGKAVLAATGDVVAGQALETGTGDGSVIAMVLAPQAEPAT